MPRWGKIAVQRRPDSVLPRSFLLCHKTGTLPQVRQCRAGTGDLRNALSNHHPNTNQYVAGLWKLSVLWPQ